MDTFYIILALYFALIFIHGAYMAGKEIGREEAFFPKAINFKLSIDGTDAIGKLERVSKALKKLNDQQMVMVSTTRECGKTFAFAKEVFDLIPFKPDAVPRSPYAFDFITAHSPIFITPEDNNER